MEFNNLIFQAWKVMEKLKFCLVVKSTVDGKVSTMYCKIERSN